MVNPQYGVEHVEAAIGQTNVLVAGKDCFCEYRVSSNRSHMCLNQLKIDA